MKLSLAILQEELLKRDLSIPDCSDNLWISSEEILQSTNLPIFPVDMSSQDRQGFLYSVFLNYMDWENALLAGISSHTSFQSIVDLASAKLSNPFVVLSTGNILLARSSNAPTEPNGTIWDLMQGSAVGLLNYYSSSEIDNFSKGMLQAPNHIFLYHSHRDKEHIFLTAGIEFGGQTIATVGAIDMNAPFTQAQLDITWMICQYLGGYLSQSTLLLSPAKLISKELEMLLDGHSLSHGELAKGLMPFGLSPMANYCLVCLRCSYHLSTEMLQYSFLELIRFQFPNAVLAVTEGYIWMAILADSFPDKNTLRFFENNDFRVGVSFPVHGFSELNEVKKQSMFSAEWAETHGTAMVSYSDISLNHMAAILRTEQTLHSFCMPEVRELAFSSKEKDHQLLACLSAYLLHGRSIADTARVLGIHRNTIIYRIERLSSIFHCELKDLPDDVADWVLLSILLLKLEHSE